MTKKKHWRKVVSISVPYEMKVRMDKMEGVNWSSVACTAFEKVLSDSKLTSDELRRRLMELARSIP